MRPKRPVVEIRFESLPKGFYLKRNLETPRAEGFAQKLGISKIQSEARKEVEKITGIAEAGIATQKVIAWGEGTWDGISNASFVATEDLQALPLERYLFHHWKPPLSEESAKDKHVTIAALGELTRRMHSGGWVHRDFYLGHIFVREAGAIEDRLCVIDVQRATRRPSWWLRSQIKDLASLHFSADPAFIDEEDRERFLKTYWQTDRFSHYHRFLLSWIRRKGDRIRRHTEKSLGIPYRDFFKNKYY